MSIELDTHQFIENVYCLRDPCELNEIWKDQPCEIFACPGIQSLKLLALFYFLCPAKSINILLLCQRAEEPKNDLH